MKLIDYIPGARTVLGVLYVCSLMLTRQLALLNTRRGRIVEDPDELGYRWEQEHVTNDR